MAADNTHFSHPEAKVGFSGGLIASLAVRIPHKVAMEMLLIGEALSVQRAYEIGFVNKIVPVGQQRQGAFEYAHKSRPTRPWSSSCSNALWTAPTPRGPSEFAGLARREVDTVTVSPDAAEGIAGFRGKRPPKLKDASLIAPLAVSVLIAWHDPSHAQGLGSDA